MTPNQELKMEKDRDPVESMQSQLLDTRTQDQRDFDEEQKKAHNEFMRSLGQ